MVLVVHTLFTSFRLLKNTEQLIKEFKIIIFIRELQTQQLQYVQVTK
jgi:hypothetical protein